MMTKVTSVSDRQTYVGSQIRDLNFDELIREIKKLAPDGVIPEGQSILIYIDASIGDEKNLAR